MNTGQKFAVVLLTLALVCIVGGINLAPIHQYAKVLWTAFILLIAGVITLGVFSD